MASWSFIGIVAGTACEMGPLGMWVSGTWVTPFDMVAMFGLIVSPSPGLPAKSTPSSCIQSTFVVPFSRLLSHLPCLHSIAYTLNLSLLKCDCRSYNICIDYQYTHHASVQQSIYSSSNLFYQTSLAIDTHDSAIDWCPRNNGRRPVLGKQ